MFSELGRCLYKHRDAFASALEEFDAVCMSHDAEMDVVRAALSEKFGCVPLIDLYRQAAIRCQKTRDWRGARKWAARGLIVYGSDAARPEAVADLQKRLAHAEAKLAGPVRSSAASTPTSAQRPTTAALVETLTCSQCGTQFQRERTRGRKPHRCPSCRGL
jgi:predicted Zn-ribbon and HTH transcriptional regulator